MKYLVLLLIVLGVVSWIRFQRRPHTPPNTPPTSGKASASPQDMLPCAHCGVHVPHNDSVRGQRGMYCSAEHRQRHEG